MNFRSLIALCNAYKRTYIESKKKRGIILFWFFSPGLKPEKVKMVAAGRNHTVVSTGQ